MRRKYLSIYLSTQRIRRFMNEFGKKSACSNNARACFARCSSNGFPTLGKQNKKIAQSQCKIRKYSRVSIYSNMPGAKYSRVFIYANFEISEYSRVFIYSNMPSAKYSREFIYTYSNIETSEYSPV